MLDWSSNSIVATRRPWVGPGHWKDVASISNNIPSRPQLSGHKTGKTETAVAGPMLPPSTVGRREHSLQLSLQIDPGWMGRKLRGLALTSAHTLAPSSAWCLEGSITALLLDGGMTRLPSAPAAAASYSCRHLPCLPARVACDLLHGSDISRGSQDRRSCMVGGLNYIAWTFLVLRGAHEEQQHGDRRILSTAQGR
jgi:hypothetical protein